jgi:hypothetical protein
MRDTFFILPLRILLPGTAGSMVPERMNFTDALFRTVITDITMGSFEALLLSVDGSQPGGQPHDSAGSSIATTLMRPIRTFKPSGHDMAPCCG